MPCFHKEPAMHRYLSVMLLCAWGLCVLLGIRLAGGVHLLPVMAGVSELMHLLTAGGPLPRRPLRSARFASAPTPADSDGRLAASGEAHRPATNAEGSHVQVE
jgi:hypothetical protein